MYRTQSSMKHTRASGIPRLRRYIALLAAPLLALSMAGCNGSVFGSLPGGGFMNYLTFLGPRIESIAITPDDAVVPSGVPVNFGVIANFSNGTSRALTDKEMARVIWTPDSPVGLASIDIQPAADPAYVTVTAIKDDYDDGVDVTVALQADFRTFSSTENLVINDALLVSISITPGVASITRLTTQKFTARGTYTDGSVHDISTEVEWSSDDPPIASIASDGNGTATGQGAGTTSIRASLGAIDELAPAALTVLAPVLESVSVTPVSRSIPEGFILQYRATAVYNDDSTQDVTDVADWVSTFPAQATVSTAAGTKGLVTAVSSGTTQIEATFDGITGGTGLTVTGVNLLYIAVTAQGGKTSIANGTKLQFTATGVFSDNTTQDLTESPLLAWGSSAASVAAFEFLPTDPKGTITAKSTGSSNVTASYNGTVTSAPFDLTVTSATLSSIIITPADPVAYVIAYGTNQQFTATGVFSDSTTQDLTGQVDWTSSDTVVANIDLNTGLAVTAAAGDTYIWARYPKGGPYTISESTNLRVVFLTLLSIEVTPATKSTWVGQTIQYFATGTYQGGYTQDLTDQVLWESSDPLVAVISNAAGSKGLAGAMGEGSAQITSTRGGVISPAANLSVTASDTSSPTMTGAQLLSGNRVTGHLLRADGCQPRH